MPQTVNPNAINGVGYATIARTVFQGRGFGSGANDRSGLPITARTNCNHLAMRPTKKNPEKTPGINAKNEGTSLI